MILRAGTWRSICELCERLVRQIACCAPLEALQAQRCRAEIHDAKNGDGVMTSFVSVEPETITAEPRSCSNGGMIGRLPALQTTE